MSSFKIHYFLSVLLIILELTKSISGGDFDDSDSDDDKAIVLEEPFALCMKNMKEGKFYENMTARKAFTLLYNNFTYHNTRSNDTISGYMISTMNKCIENGYATILSPNRYCGKRAKDEEEKKEKEEEKEEEENLEEEKEEEENLEEKEEEENLVLSANIKTLIEEFKEYEKNHEEEEEKEENITLVSDFDVVKCQGELAVFSRLDDTKEVISYAFKEISLTIISNDNLYILEYFHHIRLTLLRFDKYSKGKSLELLSPKKHCQVESQET